MKKTLSPAIRALSIVLFAILLGAAPPQAGKETILQYTVRNADGAPQEASGRRIFTVNGFTIRVREGEYKGKPALIVNREDTSIQGAKYNWEIISELAAGNLLAAHKKIVLKDGTVIDDSRQSFAHLKPAGGGPIIHVMMFPLFSRFLKLAPGAQLRPELSFQPESKPMKIIVTVDGGETITTPAGTFDCHRLLVTSDPDSLPSFMKYLPSYITNMFMNYTMWVEKKAPHTLIRMTGKSDGPDGGDKIQELVKIGRGS